MSELYPPEQRSTRSKTSRLSRSFRLTQQAELDSPQREFKTPTRLSRSKPAESPHQNDSDCQQDIVWDATSPSPNRRGKRGKNHAPGSVNISEIVNRIAPKHGRPTITEPTLQQWIGDSATIPCTPDVQAPKPKKKSPRPNAVDDLLRLAKQFDSSMFRREEVEEERVENDNVEEDQVEDVYHQSMELLSDEFWDVQNDFQEHLSPPRNNQPAATEVHLSLNRRTENDDLDFLFDGPTQHVSGRLSQPSQFKPSSGSKEAAQKQPPTQRNKVAPVSNGFKDDWEDDEDFLNDSLVLEMTQNPEKFLAPVDSSTQRIHSQPKHYGSNIPAAAIRLDQSQKVKLEKENVKPRTNFKPDYQKSVDINRIPTKSNKNQQQDCNTKKMENPQRSVIERPKSAGGSTSAAQSCPPPTTSNYQFDDLDSLFSSDPVWDDPADDDLLCEMCNDLENQIHNDKPTPVLNQLPNQRGAPQPTTTAQQPPHHRDKTTEPSRTGRFDTKESTRFTETVPKVSAGSTLPQRNGGVQSVTNKGQFTFKKPNQPVTLATNKAALKCSAAEIELKKQQAMERRRQRLQATQNLPAPN